MGRIFRPAMRKNAACSQETQMALDYEYLMSLRTQAEPYEYGDRESLLYALSVGFGRDPLNERELPFVYERHLKTVPTMAAVIAWGVEPVGAREMHEFLPNGSPRRPAQRHSGIEYATSLHGGYSIVLHSPLPQAARVSASGRVLGAWDKGKGKGALIVTESVVSDMDSGGALCTLYSTIFARDNGGFGGPTEGAPPLHSIPARPADAMDSFTTRPDQALLYRLCGDRNPHHADPAFARSIGFKMPILQGLCTYGICCRAVLKAFCNYEPERIKSFGVRFSSHVFPGETIETEMWKDGAIVSFRAHVRERDTVVIDNGKCELQSAA